MKSMNDLYYDKYLKYKKKYLDLKKIKNKLDLKGGNPDKDKLVNGAEILVDIGDKKVKGKIAGQRPHIRTGQYGVKYDNPHDIDGNLSDFGLHSLDQITFVASPPPPPQKWYERNNETTKEWLERYYPDIGKECEYIEDLYEKYPEAKSILMKCNKTNYEGKLTFSREFTMELVEEVCNNQVVAWIQKACQLEKEKYDNERLSKLVKGTEVIINKGTRSVLKGVIINLPEDRINGKYLVELTWPEWYKGIRKQYTENEFTVEVESPSVLNPEEVDLKLPAENKTEPAEGSTGATSTPSESINLIGKVKAIEAQLGISTQSQKLIVRIKNIEEELGINNNQNKPFKNRVDEIYNQLF